MSARGAITCVVALLLGACDDEPAPAREPVVNPVAETASPAEGNASEAATAEGDEAGPEAAPDEEGADEGPILAIDTHIDTPQRMLDDNDDPAGPLEGGHVDLPRMRQGGLSGAFFSVYVSPRRFEGEAAWQRALALSERIRAFTEAHPEETALCTSASEVRAAFAAGKVAVLMGVEGAHALGTDEPELALQRIRRLYELGNRYMTLAWSVDSPLGHSSLGEHPERGLTPLGRRAVRLMNELGMIVDISHVSDQTFWDTMDIVRRPVLASHSSARALADIPRNMDDAMIRRVAAGGGAVCINFFSQFIDRDYRLRRRRLTWRHRARFAPLEDQYPNWVDRGAAAQRLAMELDPELDPPTVERIAEHMAHVVEIAGAETPCLGSDYDGVPELPLGMRDVRDLGVLRDELEKRELPVRAIFGANVMRVLAAQEGPLQDG